MNGTERETWEQRRCREQVNERVSFLPMTNEDEKPCMQVAGALVFAYVQDGALVVSVDLDTVEPGAFAVYGPDGDCVPVQVYVGSDRVFDAGTS
jgi:hypothetical protein